MTDTRIPFGAVELSAVVIRACEKCGAARPDPVVPCPRCGNPDPPRVHDLGVIAAQYMNQRRRLRWVLYGTHLADWRIRRANKARRRRS